MQPDVPMSATRYQDTLYQNQGYLPVMNAKPRNLNSNENIIKITSQKQFDAYVVREMYPVLAFFYDSSQPEQVQVIADIIIPLLVNTVNKVLLIDCQTVPSLSYIYTFNRPSDKPTLVRLFQGHVLRFFNQPFTYNNVCKFVTATIRWRNKGFNIS